MKNCDGNCDGNPDLSDKTDFIDTFALNGISKLRVVNIAQRIRLTGSPADFQCIQEVCRLLRVTSNGDSEDVRLESIQTLNIFCEEGVEARPSLSYLGCSFPSCFSVQRKPHQCC